MKILDSAAQNLENPRQLKLHAYLSSFPQGPLQLGLETPGAPWVFRGLLAFNEQPEPFFLKSVYDPSQPTMEVLPHVPHLQVCIFTLLRPCFRCGSASILPVSPFKSLLCHFCLLGTMSWVLFFLYPSD